MRALTSGCAILARGRGRGDTLTPDVGACSRSRQQGERELVGSDPAYAAQIAMAGLFMPAVANRGDEAGLLSGLRT
jgi:hypothetical protein